MPAGRTRAVPTCAVSDALVRDRAPVIDSVVAVFIPSTARDHRDYATRAQRGKPRQSRHSASASRDTALRHSLRAGSSDTPNLLPPRSVTRTLPLSALSRDGHRLSTAPTALLPAHCTRHSLTLARARPFARSSYQRSTPAAHANTMSLVVLPIPCSVESCASTVHRPRDSRTRR